MPQPTSRSRWSLRGFTDAALWVGLFGALGLCGFTVAAFAGDRHWLPEVTTHFRPHYGILLSACVIIYAIASRCRVAAVLSVFALINIAFLVPRFVPHPVAPREATRLKLLLANVHTDNLNRTAIVELIQREQPDVVALLEINDAWLAALKPLTSSYPHIRSVPRSDNFGIVLLSRVPVSDLKTVYLTVAELPSIRATLTLADRQQISLLATHPLPPGSADGVLLRDQQLAAIARWSIAEPHPTVVLGDLNCTPWSPAFRTLLKTSALTDTGYGIAPTWPVKPWLLRVPLDHCLASSTLFVSEHRIGPDIGSDHFPIIVTLAAPAPAP
ncbi:MAG: endonuclease/exonuclease/phosphatase family protein [Rariglobus sp.]